MGANARGELTEEVRRRARIVWDYQRLGREPRPCDVAVVLGSHDLGVATTAADLYRRGFFPRMVISGANSPTTLARFPRGEAVHYREHVLSLGVPDLAVLTETRATNTGENLSRSRALLADSGIAVRSVMFVCKPYMERRAYATARRIWPEVEAVCASARTGFDSYLGTVGDDRLVMDTMVGDLQRVMEYPARGFSVPQEVPERVRSAYAYLVGAGFDGHLIAD
ncbi:YdcF family protein [Nocardiopsis sp. NPDC007018]|uniref:YdcF family protein n=1 Tax=Nocardiopsis sp. NPDC007018 TaxID=3155721 RepID=UPI0033E06687